MKILHIDCSPRSDSHSRRLSAAIVEKLVAAAPSASICRRDLGLEPLPHASAAYATALSSPEAIMVALRGNAIDLSEALILEVEAADAIVIGTPVNNFTVPSVLKAWIDQILRVGRTIMATKTGKTGTLQDRPVFIAFASGGVITGEWANQPDFFTSYLLAALGCVGLVSIQFLAVQGTAFLDDEQAAVMRQRALTTLDQTGLVKCNEH